MGLASSNVHSVHKPPLALAAILVFGAIPLNGQTDSATPPASLPAANAAYVPTLTFDVASVRENRNADLNAGITMSGQFVPHTTTLRLLNWDIQNIMSYAFGVDRFQLVGAPAWPWPTVFVIEAKGDSEADAKMVKLPKNQQWAEQQHMLQALLAERFKLKTHWETKEGVTYNLVVAKGGPKFSAAGSKPPSPVELKTFGDHPVPTLYQQNDGQGYEFIAHGCSMEELVATLTSQFGRPVTDKTGLTGKFDFVLKYKGRWDSDRNPDDLDPMPPMDRALQEELGLRVEATKGSTTVLVIDHIEKPSEN
jgi:uncharacterized protein (TIGR03435 family)